MRALSIFLTLPVLAQPATLDPAESLIQTTKHTLESRVKAYRAHVEAGNPRSSFRWNFEKELASLDACLARPQAPPLKHAALVAKLGYRVVGHQKVEAAFFDSVLAEVPATSPSWAIDPSLLSDLAEGSTQEKAIATYLAEARTKNPIPEVRTYLLEMQFEEALETKDEPTWKAALATLEKEHQGSDVLSRVHRSLEMYQKTAVGKAAPPLDIASLDDPKVHYTLETFKGRYVLLDFWATWCPYCVLELPYLHKAWDRFKQANFEILSLSFDQKTEDIAAFRKKPTTPMPWKHAFVVNAKHSPLSESYGVVGIPKPLLIGPDGKIIATDGELKGKELERSLEKYLKQ